MKHIIRLASILLFIGSVAVNAQEFKFGHINSQQLLQEMPEFELALNQMEKAQTDANERLKIMQTELQNQVTAYQNVAESMTVDQRTAKEAELGALNQKIQDYYSNTQQEMQQKEVDLTQPIIIKARQAVEEVGKENGFTYIFDTAKGDLLHIGVESVDVMPLVRKKLGITTTP